MRMNLRHIYRLMVASLLLGPLACTGFPWTDLPTSGDPGTSDGDSADGGLAFIDRVYDVGQGDVLSSSGGPACAQVGPPATTTHRAMFDSLNAYRIENGLEPVVYSQRLQTAIDAHLRDAWARDFFDHINPEGQGPAERAVEAGFCHPYVGENLAAGQDSAQAVMLAWQNSPGHDANMLEPAYRYAGMGFFTDSTGRHYWGQLFAIDFP